MQGAIKTDIDLFTGACEAEAIKLFLIHITMQVHFLMNWTAMPWPVR